MCVPAVAAVCGGGWHVLLPRAAQLEHRSGPSTSITHHQWTAATQRAAVHPFVMIALSSAALPSPCSVAYGWELRA